MTLTSVRPRRVAVLSVHTSPLEQPGTGDAGGMNVYVVETSKRLAQLGVEVEVFTRATSSDLPPVVELAPGITVRHLTAGPFEGLSKEDLPAQLCALTSGVLRAEAAHEPGWYDAIHSHYWLSGQVGWLASERWGVPLVHTAHTLAKVKSAADVVYACGPMAMLRAVSDISTARGIPCQVAVEESMACGVGVCMTCVLPVVGEDGLTRMVRSCVEGPVFLGDRVRWDDVGTVPSDAVGAPR